MSLVKMFLKNAISRVLLALAEVHTCRNRVLWRWLCVTYDIRKPHLSGKPIFELFDLSSIFITYFTKCTIKLYKFLLTQHTLYSYTVITLKKNTFFPGNILIIIFRKNQSLLTKVSKKNSNPSQDCRVCRDCFKNKLNLKNRPS